MAYNTSVHASTGYSLMFGRKPKLSTDLLCPRCDTSLSEYANDLHSTLETAFEHV